MSNVDQELDAIARTIIDSNAYMTLGTADENGLPWVSPVWYAPADYREFFWVSSPEARHSRNVVTRPQVSIVIFDSQAPIGAAQAVYMSAVAGEVTGDDLTRGMGIFSRRSEAQGARPWTEAEVRPPAPLRLYRATASEHFVLAPGDQRIRVSVV
jgi:Pyridoxamine 5'-phosphate oxidase